MPINIDYILYIIGSLLITINIIGYIKPLRRKWIYETYSGRISLTLKEAYKEIKREVSENNKKYVIRLTDVIYRAVAHPNKDSGVLYYYIDFFDNYFVYFISFVFPFVKRHYYPTNPVKVLKHGVGKCGVKSIILTYFLKKEKITSNIIGLNGHVIVHAEVSDNEYYVLDPDRGVVIPYDLLTIQKNSHLIEEFYREKGNTSERRIRSLIGLYSNKNLIVNKNLLSAIGLKRFVFDKASNILRWIIPVLCFIL